MINNDDKQLFQIGKYAAKMAVQLRQEVYNETKAPSEDFAIFTKGNLNELPKKSN